MRSSQAFARSEQASSPKASISSVDLSTRSTSGGTSLSSSSLVQKHGRPSVQIPTSGSRTRARMDVSVPSARQHTNEPSLSAATFSRTTSPSQIGPLRIAIRKFRIATREDHLAWREAEAVIRRAVLTNRRGALTSLGFGLRPRTAVLRSQLSGSRVRASGSHPPSSGSTARTSEPRHRDPDRHSRVAGSACGAASRTRDPSLPERGEFCRGRALSGRERIRTRGRTLLSFR
jgi:hypothetical protein